MKKFPALFMTLAMGMTMGVTLAFAAKLTAGNASADPAAIRQLAENSGKAADWLSSTGMDLPRLLNTFGHGPADGSAPGYPMGVALENELKAKNVDDRLCSEATAILRDETGKVRGVKVNPTAYYITDTSCISAATFRMNGCIMVSHAGVRIVNEEDAYTPNSEVIMNNGGETYMMVFDRTLVDKVTAAQTYIKAGYTVQADTLEELADWLDADKDAFLNTCATFTTYAKEGGDLDFGKKNFTTNLTNAPYYALLTKPAAQGTFGGITVNADTEALDENGNVMPGQYAAGECADEGTMGEAPLTVNVVFGIIAGENAAAWVK